MANDDELNTNDPDAGFTPEQITSFEAAEDRVDKWLQGYTKGRSDRDRFFLPMIEQFCRDLNEAHNEILRQQGVTEADFNKYDWPEWSPQANSIRRAEKEIKQRLAKTDLWTLYPANAETRTTTDGKTGQIT